MRSEHRTTTRRGRPAGRGLLGPKLPRRIRTLDQLLIERQVNLPSRRSRLLPVIRLDHQLQHQHRYRHKQMKRRQGGEQHHRPHSHPCRCRCCPFYRPRRRAKRAECHSWPLSILAPTVLNHPVHWVCHPPLAPTTTTTMAMPLPPLLADWGLAVRTSRIHRCTRRRCQWTAFRHLFPVLRQDLALPPMPRQRWMRISTRLGLLCHPRSVERMSMSMSPCRCRLKQDHQRTPSAVLTLTIITTTIIISMVVPRPLPRPRLQLAPRLLGNPSLRGSCRKNETSA